MKPKLFSHKSTGTPHVQLNTHKCQACWKCMADCPKKVIGKVDLPWHKHALIINPDNCTGCLKCIKVCPYNAFSEMNSIQQEPKKQGMKNSIFFIINNLLLLSGIVMVYSGLILQIGFHMGESQGHQRDVREFSMQPIQYEQARGIDINKTVSGLNYHDWSITHKFAIVIFALIMVYHIYAHWNWYKGVIKKHLIHKNNQVISLSILFLIVAITGFIPWFIDLSGSTNILRLIFIEIHDKLALILIVYLIVHVNKRKKWFTLAFAKLKK
jgi:ferredoxin